jgi:hypothetical protein
MTALKAVAQVPEMFQTVAESLGVDWMHLVQAKDQ